jgi:hydrogenase expression/formation protein HypE
MQSDTLDFTMTCPIPISEYPQVLVAHGGGGRLMHNLIGKMLLPAFQNTLLNQQHDGAVFELGGVKLAFSTDSYVVNPLFFPGGDIGKLAVDGTVNDLAMCGARPLFLSLGLIIEEGLPMDTLWRITQSIQAAAAEAGVEIVTGDTKVVDCGKGDGIFINTAGVGIIEHGQVMNPRKIQAGDMILLNGDVGRHGMAIMATREGLTFESEIESDLAPLNRLTQKLLAAGVEIHCMRDLTRGGLASGLIEIAETANAHLHIETLAIEIREDVRGACEILGLDPLYVANEGRFIAFVKPSDARQALEIMQADSLGENAAIIGQVVDDNKMGLVTIKSEIGSTHILDMLSGEQLPRIC